MWPEVGGVVAGGVVPLDRCSRSNKSSSNRLPRQEGGGAEPGVGVAGEASKEESDAHFISQYHRPHK